MASIDFVYFDLGNVLLNFSHQLACEQIAELANLSAEQVWQVAFETPLVSQYERGSITDSQFYSGFCEATGANVQESDFLLAFSDIFHLNQSVIPLVVELSQIGFPKGILSNTCAAHWQFATQKFRFLKDFFSINVLSFEVGSAKPDRSIYDSAIKRAKSDPGRIFFVDDRHENVAGAVAAGLDGVLFESATQLRNLLFARGIRV